MGSTLATIRGLLDDQLDFGTSSSATNPTSTLLNNYINNSIRKITRRDKPRELYTSSATTANITANANTVTVPTTLLLPDSVYYKGSSGTRYEVLQKPMDQIISLVSPNLFFDTTYTGQPQYYDVKGTSLVFSKHFDRTASNAIEILGWNVPTVLSADGDTTELPLDYDLLIVYESAILFYQKDDDAQNLQVYRALADQERKSVRAALKTNDSQTIQMDPYVFSGRGNNSISNPNVFFQG